MSTALEKADLLRRLPGPDERRSIRNRAHLTLNDIAQDLGVTAQGVLAWERGATPSEANLAPYVELLEALSVTEGGHAASPAGTAA